MCLFSFYNKIFLFGVFGKKNCVSVLPVDCGVFCRIVILGLDCHNAFLKFSVHTSNLVGEVSFILLSDERTKRRAISTLLLLVAILRQERHLQSQLGAIQRETQTKSPIPSKHRTK